MAKRLLFLCATIYFGLLTYSASGQSVELARDYYQHGLDDRAKEVLITLLHGTNTARVDAAKALYLLGQISFDEGRTNVALADWRSLVHDYPETTEAKEVDSRLKQLSELAGRLPDGNVASPVARSYLSNGDLWTRNNREFLIDSSGLPEVELALEWYDRAIEEFPNSTAAELAYERKLLALIGGKEIGENRAYGMQADFDEYMPQVIHTFSNFETAFPNNSFLQAFRYQIAQAYWEHRDLGNTRRWLQKIIDKSGGEPTFYSEIAKAQLERIE
jgi:tetratricopeptide (TPR) repeat protein